MTTIAGRRAFLELWAILRDTPVNSVPLNSSSCNLCGARKTSLLSVPLTLAKDNDREAHEEKEEREGS